MCMDFKDVEKISRPVGNVNMFEARILSRAPILGNVIPTIHELSYTQPYAMLVGYEGDIIALYKEPDKEHYGFVYYKPNNVGLAVQWIASITEDWYVQTVNLPIKEAQHAFPLLWEKTTKVAFVQTLPGPESTTFDSQIGQEAFLKGLVQIFEETFKLKIQG